MSINNKAVDKFSLSLVKPDGTELGFINANNISFNLKGGEPYELKFSIPEFIDIKGEYKKNNPYYDLVKTNYFVDLEIDNDDKKQVFRFKLSNPTSDSDGNKSKIIWVAYGSETNLNNKKITNWAGVPVDDSDNTGVVLISTTTPSVINNININGVVKEVSVNPIVPIDFTTDGLLIHEVANNLLKGTGSTWTLKYIDELLENEFRSGLKFGNTFLLQALQNLASSYGAVPIFDNINREISFLKIDSLGKNLGLTIEYGKYLKNINKQEKAENIITRLRVLGKDNKGINSLTSTGENYIEDYTYFLGSFERDDQGNVVKSSEWMSDNLASSLVDYFKLIEDTEVTLRPLLDDRDVKFRELAVLENDLVNLKIGEEKVEILTAVNDTIHDTKVTLSKVPTLINETRGVGVVNKSDEDGLLVDTLFYQTGDTLPPVVNNYTIEKVDSGFGNTIPNIQGRELQFNIADILPGDLVRVGYRIRGLAQIEDEIDAYETVLGKDPNNSNAVAWRNYIGAESSPGAGDFPNGTLNKERQDKLLEIGTRSPQVGKLGEIQAKEDEIANLDTQINAIQDTLIIENNFTQEEVLEWDNFIVEGTYQNTNIEDSQLLFSAAKEHLLTKRFPEATVVTDVISILQTKDAKFDWDKINLYDKINIRFERFDIDIESQIFEIGIEVDTYKMKFLTSTVTDYINDTNDYIETFFSSTARTGNQVDYSEQNWDGGGQAGDKFNELEDDGIDATEINVKSATGQSVIIDERGITVFRKNTIDDFGNVKEETDDEFVRITNGSIILSKDGGTTYSTAITPDKIVAETIKGNVLVGNELKIIGNDGSGDVINVGDITVDSLDDDFGITVDGDTGVPVKVVMGKINGFRIDSDGDTVFKVDGTGRITANDIDVESGSIAGYNVINDDLVSKANNYKIIPNNFAALGDSIGFASDDNLSLMGIKSDGSLIRSTTFTGTNQIDISTNLLLMSAQSAGGAGTALSMSTGGNALLSGVSAIWNYDDDALGSDEIATRGYADTASNRHFKDNINNVEDFVLIDFLKKIEFKKYKWKKDNNSDFGFIMDELKTIDNDLVNRLIKEDTTTIIKDEEGNDIEVPYTTYRPSTLANIALATCKIQQKKIEDLESLIQELKELVLNNN